MKTAIITGITGQDGAYLAKYLLNQGYSVYGTYRRTSNLNFWRIEELGIKDNDNLHLICDDLTDLGGNIRMLEKVMPDEVYNLAAQSFVGYSFEQPITTGQITGLGTLRILEAIRIVNKNIRFYQASTSEMFGKVSEIPQNEKTPFYPRSPYGIAKLYAHWMTINYRESYDMFATCGILFNHESPLRGIEFVTRKITDALVKISLGKQKFLELGNLDARRDWGFAGDYVYGMWLMLQHDKPDNFILATGETNSVRSFVEMAAKFLNIDIEWHDKGINEVGINSKNGDKIIRINSKYYRPSEVDILLGNPKYAQETLGWRSKTSLKELCSMMIKADLERNI